MRRNNVQLVHHWRSSTHLRRLWRGRDKRGLLAAGALSSSQPVPEDAELLAPTSVSSPAASAPASDVELEAPPPR